MSDIGRTGAGRLRALLTAVTFMAACGSQEEGMAETQGPTETEQPAPEERQSFAFRGTVQAVNTVAETVTVANEDVPGWMMSMTMSYRLEDAEMLTTLEPGDRITATVYAGDFRTLYAAEVVEP